MVLLSQKKTSVPKPRDIVFEEFKSLVKRLTKLYEIFHKRDSTSIRIVTTPEQIVLEEARRNYTWLQLYNFNVDAVYMNKLYPKEAMEGYFEGWENIQKDNIHLAEESFSEQKLFKLELQAEEIHGKDSLEKIARLLYKTINPAEIFCQAESFKIEEVNGTRILTIHLPFAKEENISVIKEKYDIIISLLNETRRFHLPDKLKTRKISEYSYKNGELKINMDYE